MGGVYCILAQYEWSMLVANRDMAMVDEDKKDMDG